MLSGDVQDTFIFNLFKLASNGIVIAPVYVLYLWYNAFTAVGDAYQIYLSGLAEKITIDCTQYGSDAK